MKKKIIALIVIRFITTSLNATIALAAPASPASDDQKLTEAVINNCVKITMSVKGCGDDRLTPCESSFCYQTYDFALSSLDRMATSDLGSTMVPSKREIAHKKKHRRPSSA